MTFGIVLLAPALCCAALDVETLLASLARPAPATTSFVEVRYSKLLDQPLIVKGELEYLEDGVLARTVKEPFKERTEIHGERVIVERAGKPRRQFSLKRAPELRGLLGSFAAVLGGSRASLEQNFNLALQGEQGHWQLRLTPKSTRVGRYMQDIVINGQENEPRCISVNQPDQDGSIMIVGAAADAALPTPLTRDELNRFCTSGGA